MARGRKTGGRQKGSKNKIQRPAKALLETLFQDNFAKFKRELNKLEGKDFVDAILKITPYVAPKLQSNLEKIDFSNLDDEQAEKVLEQLTEKLKSDGI